MAAIGSGALVIDAAHFVPQSRPRLFIIAVDDNQCIPNGLLSYDPDQIWHTRALTDAFNRLPRTDREHWLWWYLAPPPRRRSDLADLIEDQPKGVRWHTSGETQKLLGMMSQVNLNKVSLAKKMRRRVVGTIYKRTRRNESGIKVQRAEIRFDNIAGCLRTPLGGSSRQTIMIVDGNEVRSRLLSAREAARLMGLPENYVLPENYNEAYHVAGDGVVVPVIRHIANGIIEPLLASSKVESPPKTGVIKA